MKPIARICMPLLALPLLLVFASLVRADTGNASKADTSKADTNKTEAADKVDRANMDQTHIIGNRELPKVLYIVPWKKALPGDLSGRPLRSVLDEEMAPVDRDVFRRQVRYSGEAAAPAAASPAGAAAPPAPDPGASGK